MCLLLRNQSRESCTDKSIAGDFLLEETWSFVSKKNEWIYTYHVHLREPSCINNMNEINVNEIRSEQVFFYSQSVI